MTDTHATTDETVVSIPWCEQCECWHDTDADHIYAHRTIDSVIKLVWWFVVCVALAAIFYAVAMSRAGAELCMVAPDAGITKKAGYRWQWRDVDGRKCWFYSNRLILQEDLIWSYTSHEFDSDIDRIIERKFYLPDADENGLLIERKQ